MNQRPKLDVRQATRLSPQLKIILGVGIGMAMGALLALLVVKTQFNTNNDASPGFKDPTELGPPSELEDPPIMRRPPAIEQGGTMRSIEDTVLQHGRTVQSLR